MNPQEHPLYSLIASHLPHDDSEIHLWLYGILIKGDTPGEFDMFHLRDWLVSARQHNAPFLRELDANGIPKRFSRLDAEAANNAADKWFAKLNDKQMQSTETDGDTETVMRFEDGYRIAHLLTVEALRYEGAHMGHCIGGGSYDEAITGKDYTFYSLRDSKNRPHATFEVGRLAFGKPELIQLQGKQNKPPVKKYWPMLRAFIKCAAFNLDGSPAWNAGLVQDALGQYHDIYNLPEGLCLPCGHDFEDTDITTLPRGLRVMGNLSLVGSSVTELPEDLYVSGNLHPHKDVVSLPRGLHVRRCLHLEGTEIFQLPDDIKLDGDFWAGGTLLLNLPENLHIGGSLCLDGSGIKALPEGLNVGGDLSIVGLDIRKLPRKMTVGGRVYATQTPLKKAQFERRGITIKGGVVTGGNVPVQDQRLKLVQAGMDVVVRGGHWTTIEAMMWQPPECVEAAP